MADQMNGIASLHCAYLKQLEEALPNVTGQGSLVSLFNLDERAPMMNDLKFFLDACATFRTMQYKPNPSNLHRDYECVWLPLLLLGDDWQYCIQKALGFNLPKKLNHVDSIFLRPDSKDSAMTFTIFMRDHIEHVTENEYMLFDNQIKGKYNIRSEFNVETGQLRILGTKSITSSKEHGSLLIEGELPKWVDVLISIGGVARIEINYPISPLLKSSLSNILVSTLVIPKWSKVSSNYKSKDCFNDYLCFGATTSFFTILTGNNPEFFPLIDSIFERWLELPCALQGKGFDVESMKNSVLKRHFVSLTSTSKRQGESFNSLDHIFNMDDSDSVIKSPFICNIENIDDHIFSAISSNSYLDDITLTYEKICTNLVSSMETSIQKQPDHTSWVKKISVGNSVIIHPGKDETILLREYLKHISNSLQLVRNNFSCFQSDHYDIISRVWGVLDKIKENKIDDDFSTIIGFLLNIIISDKASSEHRSIALSGVLYFMNIMDVIENSLYDDTFALLYTIKSLKSSDVTIPQEINEWRVKESAHIDKYLDPHVQRRIKEKCDSYRFSNLV